MRLAMFDLDGTLTRTTGVDDACFVRAMREVLGLSGFGTDWAEYPHATDEGLTQDVCRLERRLGGLGRAPTEGEAASVRRRFIELVGAAAAEEPGRFGAVEGAERMLGALNSGATDGWTAAIATGAWRESAVIKMRAAGMSDVLEGERAIPAAFAGRTSEGAAAAREEIVGLAVERAAARAGVARFERIVCVGDGVWDLRTARRLGHGFVGVGQGRARERLLGEGAGIVLRDFADLGATMRALDGAVVP